jgi:hypothetical protein
MPCRLPQKFGDNKNSPMACAVANFAGTSTFAMKQNKNVNNFLLMAQLLQQFIMSHIGRHTHKAGTSKPTTVRTEIASGEFIT